MADYTFLDHFEKFSKQEKGEGWGSWFFENGLELWSNTPILSPNSPVYLSHVVFGLVGAGVIVALTLVARGKYKNLDEALIPEGRMSIRNGFEFLFESLLKMMTDMMGEKHARKWFPLIASLAIYILVFNLMGLVPGFLPPTQFLTTGAGPAILVFICYNIAGISEHGFVKYMAHFGGPFLGAWYTWPLFILIFCIEIVGAIFRPISLSVRLTGNMTGDHMVLGAFGNLASDLFGVPILFPIPFLFLGLMVCCIQTLVFCLLSSVYISMAVAHEEH
jgi:F-type H+-transporting ATPase subunit a